MKTVIENQKPPGAGDEGMRRAFKWMERRKGVWRFRSHEEADAWWKERYLEAYRRAKVARSDDLFLLRQFLGSQGITPPE